MPFIEVDIEKVIEERRQESESFRKVWDESREEYRLIGEMIALRKEDKKFMDSLSDILSN